MLELVKKALRISNPAFDDEIEGMIAAARADLVLAGVNVAIASLDTDALINRAIIIYCKAEFGYDNPDADRFRKSYDAMKMSLTLAGDYSAME